MNNSDIANSWFKKGDQDLKNATIVIEAEEAPIDTVCFHCQQAIEKYLKGLMAYNNMMIPKMHDLEKLILLLIPSFPQIEPFMDEVESLSDYAVEVRYPGFYEEIPIEEGKKALEIAQKIKTKILEIIQL